MKTGMLVTFVLGKTRNYFAFMFFSLFE